MSNLIVITGASRGFGKGICQAFFESELFINNTEYILTSTQQKDLENVKSEFLNSLKQKGIEHFDNIKLVPCDLSDIKTTKSGFEKIINHSSTKKYSKVFIILNHGTLGSLSYVPDLYEDLDKVSGITI